MKIQLSSLTYLKSILTDKFYYDHLRIYDLDNLERLKEMTDDEYRRFLSNFYRKNWFKMKPILDKFINHK